LLDYPLLLKRRYIPPAAPIDVRYNRTRPRFFRVFQLLIFTRKRVLIGQ
jgi:hypothetical protein